MVLSASARLRMTPSLPASGTRWEKSPAIAALTMPPTAASNSFITLAVAAARSAALRDSCSLASASSLVLSCALSRNTRTALAIAPSSSLRSEPGTATCRFPRAKSPITAVIAVTGREIDRPIPKANPETTSAMNPIDTCISNAVLARDSRLAEVELAFSSLTVFWIFSMMGSIAA
jgi:hypothetical protein